jgi:hypothetical protein
MASCPGRIIESAPGDGECEHGTACLAADLRNDYEAYLDAHDEIVARWAARRGKPPPVFTRRSARDEMNAKQDRVRLASALAGHLRIWHEAVATQRDRLVAADPGSTTLRQSDAFLFLLALRNLARAVDAVARRLGGRRAAEAFIEFTTRVPRWKDIRDVIEHFDAYEAAEGNLPTAATGSVERRTTSGGVLCIVTLADGIELEVGAAAMAAAELMPAAMADIDDVLRD